MAAVTVHSLKTKDPSTMTGECTICGLVAIAKAGRGFMCGEKKKLAQRAWRAKNSARSAEDRRRKSEHELSSHDYVELRAWCSKCDVWVTMVPWGRGYACDTRARELRTNQETTPNRPCRECWIIDGDRVWLVNGSCPRCTDPALYDTGAALRQAEYRASGLEGVPDGFGVVDLTNFDPYGMPDDEAAVPGWGKARTLGSRTRPWNQV